MPLPGKKLARKAEINMSDESSKQSDQPRDPAGDAGADEKPVDAAGRRRFIKGVMGTAPVLLTLASRPVLGGGVCTISGMLSGNVSSPGAEPCQGCTPGFWKVKQHIQNNWPQTKFSPCQTFQSVFGVTVMGESSTLTLIEALYLKGGANANSEAATARHAVAGLLNSADPYVHYGYTAQDFIQLVNGNWLSNNAWLHDQLVMLNQRDCPLGSNSPTHGAIHDMQQWLSQNCTT